MKKHLLLNTDATEGTLPPGPELEKSPEGGSGNAQTEIIAGIQRTMPAMGSGGTASAGPQFEKPPGKSGRPAKPDDQLKHPRRKPLKNAPTAPGDFTFRPPPIVENQIGENLSAVAGQIAAPEETLTAEDFAECGECFAELHVGFYEAKTEPIISDARAKLPGDTVDKIASTLVVSDRTKQNLQKGYTEIAEAFNISPKWARGAGFLNACRSLHTQQMAAIQTVRDLIANLPTAQQPANVTPINAMQAGGLNR